MRAAIYTRFSSDKQREASSEDQRRNCERRAETEAWEIAAHFKDEGISGSRTDRPGYQQMLKAAMAGEFGILLLDDLSRLSRDQVESESAIRRLEHRGIRVIAISDGYDSQSKSRKIQRGIKGLMNEVYLDDLRDKTHRGLEGQAIKGNNAGGRTYGYRHVPIEDPVRRDPLGRPLVVAVRREIDGTQAEVVRRIFAAYAEGKSPRAIAEELNRDGIASPGATWNRRAPGRGWAGTAIAGPIAGTGILNNELYTGRYIWNRSRWVKDPDTGKRERRVRPETEWVVNDMPELRIVDDATWQAVKRRQQERADAIGTRIRAGLVPIGTHAAGGAPGKYLFSTLLKCGTCGASFVMVSKTEYGCASRANGRKQFCANVLRVKRSVVESRLLAGIKEGLLTPEVVREVRERFRKAMAERIQAAKPDTKRIDALTAEIGHLSDAIANGLLRSSPALAERLQRAESALARARSDETPQTDKVARLIPQISERYRELVANLESSSGVRNVGRARTELRHLIGDQVRLFPAASGDYLEAEFAADGGGLVRLAANSLKNQGTNNWVAGTGFEPVTFGL